MENKKEQKKKEEKLQDDGKMNQQLQGVDKAPGEEDGKGEQVTKFDLKNKAVDEDPEEDHKH